MTDSKNLIKSKDVEAALKEKEGSSAELTSFEIKDFTAKGDNYVSTVTSVSVKFKKDGEEKSTSMVVKLNPSRGTEGFGQLTNVLCDKELNFYTTILPQFNAELVKLDLNPLRLPKLYKVIPTEEKEVIFLEDMRELGYKMFDRQKGLDYQHTNLILEEIGRFHAASVLYLSSDKMRETDPSTLPVFRDPFGHFDMEGKTFVESREKTSKILDAQGGYEYASNFMRKNGDFLTESFKKQANETTDRFRVICHGDCWNNNFLFRYNAGGSPIECCMVDLQCTRVGSAAIDLNYMLYCSLTGEVRTTYLDSYFANYYSSFASVLSEAGTCMPFTLKDLKEEFYNKNLFGMTMGMLLIPVVLVNPDDAPSLDEYKDMDSNDAFAKFQTDLLELTMRSPLLKSRLLSMFDEMKENGLFDEMKDDETKSEPTNPHELVKSIDVAQALRVACGRKAQLKSFSIVDFTSKGDNYACVVTSVKVTYLLNEKTCDVSFVVKLNPCRGSGGMGAMSEIMFSKETQFYEIILPKLNNQLIQRELSALRTPKHYFSVTKKGHQVIYLEDMRAKGYKMCDRKIGMSEHHTYLILKELGKFHASSILWMAADENKNADINAKYPALGEAMEMMTEGKEGINMQDMFDSYLDKSAFIAEKNKGYEHVAEFLRKQKPTMEAKFMELLTCQDKFKVICHGDCWNNNFLFRYDDKGHPVECCLVDFQIARVASPALDLNYMLYCSLTGEVRNGHMSEFFAHYYASIASVLAADNKATPFTLQEIVDEYNDKSMFGLLMGMTLIPIVLVDPEDAPTFDHMKGANMEEAFAEFQNKVMEITLKSPHLTPRFLSMFDDVAKTGLFEK